MDGRYRALTIHVRSVDHLRPKTHRRKIENERLQQHTSRIAAAGQNADEVFLIWLPKSQPIDHALFPELGKARDIPPKGALEHMPADLSAVEHPPGTHAALINEARRVLQCALPRRAIGHCRIAQHFIAQRRC